MRKLSTYQHQQGVIIIIALVLMVAMAVSAVAVIRLSRMDELVNNNTRARTIALQSAQAALDYCRTRIFSNLSVVKILPSVSDTNEGTAWQTMSNWTADNTNQIPTNYMGSEIAYRKFPDCMIEDITPFINSNTPPEMELNKFAGYRITARGFSPNYAQDGDFQTAGSQVWLQVVVTRGMN